MKKVLISFLCLASFTSIAQTSLPNCCIEQNIIYKVDTRLNDSREPGDIMGGASGSVANISHLIQDGVRVEAISDFVRTCQMELSDEVEFFKLRFFGHKKIVRGTVSEALTYYYELADRSNGYWKTVIPTIPSCIVLFQNL